MGDILTRRGRIFVPQTAKADVKQQKTFFTHKQKHQVTDQKKTYLQPITTS